MWESIQISRLFIKTEARQKCICIEKGCVILPDEEKCNKEVVKSFI